MHMARARVPPGTALIACRAPCSLLRQPARHQVACARVETLPLPPQDAAQLVPHPSVALFQPTPGLSQLEVSRPATQHRIEVLDRSVEFASTRPEQQSCHFLRQLLETRGRNTQLRLLMPRHAVAQKLALPWPRHRTFAHIDLELEPRAEKLGQTL